MGNVSNSYTKSELLQTKKSVQIPQIIQKRDDLSQVKRIVVKVGSSTISDNLRINETALDGLVHDLATVRHNGYEVILVTSGAIAAGWPHLGLLTRPQTLPALQASAAVGQIRLMAAYEERFRHYGQCPALMLLTQDDFSNRTRYTRMNDTLHTLLQLGAIPIINENDSVSVEEIKVGDNDTLSAYVTNLAQADLLIILSDQHGFFTEDPRLNPNSELIYTVDDVTEDMWQAAGQAGTKGTGGMLTKLHAAEIVTSSGEMVAIAYGREPLVITRILKGELLGTLFLPNSRISGRKRWIAYSRPPQGTLVVDNGAHLALLQGWEKSLLPAGVKGVEGHFNYSDTVSCVTENRIEFARGLTNYNSTDASKLAGKQTQDIGNILGSHDYDEIIHRDNLVLLNYSKT